MVNPARIAHHLHAVRLERTLQQDHRLVGRYIRFGGQGDGALDRLVQHIIGLQDVVHQEMDHVHNGRILQLEGAWRALQPLHLLRGGDDFVVAPDDARFVGSRRF